MSWLLKQAEDILNRVDQQTNAALQAQNKTNKVSRKDHEIEFISDRPLSPSPPPNFLLAVQKMEPTRTKKQTVPDFVEYLNGNSTSHESTTNKSNVKRSTMNASIAPVDQTANQHLSSVSLPLENHSQDELIGSLRRENRQLIEQQQKTDRDLQTFKRQIIQYQHQINESDALLHDLRSRESDANDILAAKDSELRFLRIRLTELEELLTAANLQAENQSARINFEKTNEEIEVLQNRLSDIEQKNQAHSMENQRLIDDNQKLESSKQQEKQQVKHWKSLFQQMEVELNEYKSKAQRILQNKDQLINKLKEIAQHRSSTPTSMDPQNDVEAVGSHLDSTLFDVSHVGGSTAGESLQWLTVQNEQLKNENDLFKQELQVRESTIHHLREDVQQIEIQLQQSADDFERQIQKLNDQLIDERERSNSLKQDLLSMQDEYKREKKVLQGQIFDRERDLERLRQQLTSKTINQVHDEELERRLQTLTESVLHKQTVIESLQADKSSLNLKLERLEQRLDEYENIRRTSKDSYSHVSTTSISLDDSDSLDNLRHRLPLLRETPTDVHLTKKVKRAANELDRWAIRLTIFLRRYPFVRLFVLFYICILHLWTLLVLCTYATNLHT